MKKLLIVLIAVISVTFLGAAEGNQQYCLNNNINSRNLYLYNYYLGFGISSGQTWCFDDAWLAENGQNMRYPGGYSVPVFLYLSGNNASVSYVVMQIKDNYGIIAVTGYYDVNHLMFYPHWDGTPYGTVSVN